MKGKYNISFIGAGNLAHHLAKRLYSKQFSIKQICSRNLENAQELAKEVGANWLNDLNDFDPNVDVIIIAVSDDAIAEVIEKLNTYNALVVHTSGSKEMEVLSRFEHHGIFYPLQTFSKNKPVDFNQIPICIEANSVENEEILASIARSISTNIYQLNSEERKKVHLAAVFACNFSNHMYTIAESILNQHNLDFNLLRPLIAETARKIVENSPIEMQTGPAKRNDQETIQKHLTLLADSKDYRDIYALISNNILKEHGKF